MCLTETHITEETQDFELIIDNYFMIRCNSNSKYTGGVIAYVYNRLQITNCSCICVQCHYWYIYIQTKIHGQIYDIGICYKSPNAKNKLEDFLVFFDKQCEELWENQNKIFFFGDFNINFADNNKSKRFQELLNNYGLKQMIKEYTHVTSSTKTLIDLIITNEYDTDTLVETIPKISDHYWTIAVVNEHIRTSRTVKKIPKIDIVQLCKELCGCDWHCNEEDIDQLLDAFYENFNHCINLVKKERNSNVYNKYPWINRNIVGKMRDRDDKYKKFLLTQSETDWNEFKKLRNLCVSAIRKEKKEYFYMKIDCSRNNGKQMWKTLKTLLKGTSKSEIKEMKFENITEVEESIIANKLNVYYVTSIEEIVGSIGTGDESKCPLPSKGTVNTFSTFQTVSLNHLRKKIHNIKSNNNPTEVLGKNILKNCFHVFGFPLLNLVNKCIKDGVLPHKLKCSVITPVPKVKNTTKCSEMRPINVLMDLEKLIEIIVYEQLINYVQENKILSNYQAGFRKQFSTETALQLVLEDWRRGLKNNECIIAVFIDLKRAFETIDRKRLLMKLKVYGLRETVLGWFEDYLRNRVQHTKINNFISDACKINVGVPQGSILGPLLFILYINDLPDILKFSKIQMFADDTLVYVKSGNLLQAISMINYDLRIISNWLKVNKLKLNVNKSKCMLLGKHSIIQNVDIEIDNEIIEILDSFKYLGIILDSNLKFQEYFENLIKKLSCKVGYFKRVSVNLSLFSKKTIYNSIIYPNFLYCPSVLWSANENVFERLQVLQNKCMRIILNKDKYTSINYMLKELGWLKVKILIKYLVIIFIFKLKNNLLPCILKEYTVQNLSFHDYNTRTHNDFHIFTNKANLNYKSIFNKGIIEFNNLNNEIKSLTNLKKFKNVLKKHLFTNQFDIH